MSEIRFSAHSNIFYWWIVWLYGYMCAVASYISHVDHITPNGNHYRIFPGAWLGISYVTILLFVLAFSNLRSNGRDSLLIILTVALALAIVELVVGWNRVASAVPLFGIYMNIGFYMLISTALLFIWVATIFIIDKLEWWSFSSRFVSRRHLFDHQTSLRFDTAGIVVIQHADDLFKHKFLGLGLLGLGTGDLEISGPGHAREIISNVWRVDKKRQQVERILGIHIDTEDRARHIVDNLAAN